MNNLQKIVEEKERAAAVRLAEKRREIGAADGPNESRYVSATRWALENEILMLEREVERARQALAELVGHKRIVGGSKIGVGRVVTVEISGKMKEFFLTKTHEDMELGFLPITSIVGKNLIGLMAGDEASYRTESGEQKMKIIRVE